MFQPDHTRAVGHRHRRSGTRSAMRIEHRNLTQHFAVRVDAQQLHTLVGGLSGQFDAAFLQQIHAMVGVSLAEDEIALVVFGMQQIRQQFPGFFGRNLLEQRGVQQRLTLIVETTKTIDSVGSIRGDHRRASVPPCFCVFRCRHPCQRSLSRAPSTIRATL